MHVVLWTRVSSDTQDNQRQILNLKKVAEEKDWSARRVFQEKASGTVIATQRTEFNKLLAYVVENNIKVVMVSEISRLGRKVIDILSIIELLHKNNIGLYIQQFNMLSYQDGKAKNLRLRIAAHVKVIKEIRSLKNSAHMFIVQPNNCLQVIGISMGQD